MLDPLENASHSTWVEEPLELMLAELPLGVVHLDQDGRVAHFNPPAGALLEGAVGAELERTLAEMCARASSAPVPIEAALSVGRLGEVRVLVARAACLDGYLSVLERSTAARVRAENQVLRALLCEVSAAASPPVAAHRALSTIGAALAGSSLVLYEIDGQRTLKCLAHVGVPTQLSALLDPHEADERTSLVGRVFATGRPLHVSNLARSFFPFERSLPGGERFAALALPVFAAGDALGALYVIGPRTLLTEGELKLLQGLADAVGSHIARARKDHELAAQRAAMATLLENLPDAALELTPSGTVVAAAGRVEPVLGIGASALVGRHVTSLLIGDDRPRLEQLLAGLGKNGQRLAQVVVQRGSDEVVCEVSLGSAPNASGEVLIRALFRDVSERHRLEQEVARVRDFAVQRDRLATIGQLAAGVAHEINNPLSFVKANLSLISDILMEQTPSGAGPMGEVVEMSREALSGVDRIATIVANLKGMARSRPGEKASFDPTVAVQQAVQFFTGAKHCRALVSMSLADGLPLVVGEAGGLSQVILNLLDNAFDATEGKGHVSVTGQVVGDRVHIAVADDGRGIPEEARSHIFELFFTTKGAGKGTGLGLHISREIIAKWGGVLRFESGPSGTTFVAELPIAPVDEGGGFHG